MCGHNFEPITSWRSGDLFAVSALSLDFLWLRPRLVADFTDFMSSKKIAFYLFFITSSG